MVHPVLLAALGLGGLYLLTRSSNANAATTGPNPSQAQLNQLNALNQQSADFNAQAQALGLTQQQAQDAYDTGLSPQEYSEGVLNATPASSSTSGLYHDGEYETTTGAPILYDEMGGRCILSASGVPYYF
jgi:hypothetical protein